MHASATVQDGDDDDDEDLLGGGGDDHHGGGNYDGSAMADFQSSFPAIDADNAVRLAIELSQHCHIRCAHIDGLLTSYSKLDREEPSPATTSPFSEAHHPTLHMVVPNRKRSRK